MNEFMEQFLIEARELVEQANTDLLAMEERPGDADAIDGAFRAFHTLKGAAGIIEFPAMERAVHAAEEVLSKARSGAEPATQLSISRCLSCLDQVARWLDMMEETGVAPDGAEAADAVVALFASYADDDRPAASRLDAWLRDLWLKSPTMRAQARCAVLYSPDPDCFFEGEDPLARFESDGNLLAIDLVPRDAARIVGDINPFTCNLLIFAVTASSMQTVAARLRTAIGEVDLHELSPPVGELPRMARDLLAAQIDILRGARDDGFVGRAGSVARLAVNVLHAAGRDGDAHVIADLARNAPGDDYRSLLEALENLATLENIPSSGPGTLPHEAPQSPLSPQDQGARSLRVDVERIEALVRLAGEFTVLKNAVGHTARLAERGGDLRGVSALLKDQHGRLGRMVEDLQHAVLSMRVLPLRHVFHRLPRPVRDMGNALGKSIRLDIEGDETEADKAVAEALFEPILHVLRNAADHGIESPEGRIAAGKPATGVISLRAWRNGDHLIVEVADDGRGIDVARLRIVAAERGVAPAATIAAMDDAQAIELIFVPGFSTAANITGYSGRGVGMDAVRVAVERLGGRAGVESRLGHGSTVRLTLPFTVMKAQVMTVEAGGQILGIPLEAVIETVRVPRTAISAIGAAHAFVWRERTVPLFNLAQALGLERAAPLATEAVVAITIAAGQVNGLEVERVGERIDVMLRPMESILSGLPCAGTTLLGDGRVLIVLDLHELLL
ncbi:chemotaxis protein CheA [Starkeya sp. ORNL1]|uniref:chemotaxis protein CheA n=1 Tax=Starkeya sp. ORNL1 TaxID=2709380 RepID=UPI001FEF31FD|nr:chemotaxis protein CheA [Starkeya sp. ORNL1]